jgi:hypothetical protein
MVRVSSAVLALVVAASFGTASFAATVNVVQGQVLIRRSTGTQIVNGSTEAQPGEVVAVNPGGIAQIVYPDGCVVQVQPPAVVTITPQSPCQTQQAPPAEEEPAQEGPTIGYGTIVVGAVVVGGGLAAALILLNQSDKPASP